MKTLASLLLVLPCAAQNRVQVPTAKEEAIVVCPEVRPPAKLSPYEFAKSTLVSLWYARNGAERGNEITQAVNTTDNMFSFLTAVMRITKSGTNDFICAKRAILPFAALKDGNSKIAAQFLAVIYDAHINIDGRLVELVKTMDTTKQGELMDNISTLQVERSQRWADLDQPTLIVVAGLIDLNRPDEHGKATWLAITKAQKATLLDWMNGHFTEFKNGSPESQWSEPSKTVQLYLKAFEGRKCSDE